LCDSWIVFDNEEYPKIIAKGIKNQEVEILEKAKWISITNF